MQTLGGGIDMTPIFFDYFTGRLFEWFMWGLVLALLTIVFIWAAVGLATWVFPRMKGGIRKALDLIVLPRFLRDGNAN